MKISPYKYVVSYIAAQIISYLLSTFSSCNNAIKFGIGL